MEAGGKLLSKCMSMLPNLLGIKLLVYYKYIFEVFPFLELFLSYCGVFGEGD